MRFLSLNYPFFSFSTYFDFFIDLIVIFGQILFLLKRFRCCIIEIQISLLFRQRLKLKSGFFLFHGFSLSKLPIFLVFATYFYF